MKLRLCTALALIILFASASPARADITFTPYIGALFGGDLPDAKTTYGASATFMGAGIIGFEADFNYTPAFVPETTFSPAVAQASLMGNLIVGIPIGGDSGGSVRPYVAGGAGLHRATATESDFDDRITSNDFAINFGGGVMGFFNDHVGIRGDLRYFRTLRDDAADANLDFELGSLNFLRWSIGAAFRF